ncbi:hypothetical protein EDC04DRAFT_2901417 [Pisolithus marmoratus]|nr:hypothetical protein EDC04DRAFT_2901417 [Pisolithus marmoratus]
MGKKHYQLKAAHAQASRWKAHTSSTTVFREVAPSDPPMTNPDELTHGSDCKYTGGVNHNPDGYHHQDTCELLDLDGSDAASLCELDGDELEENLAALGQSVEMMNKPNPSGWNEMF